MYSRTTVLFCSHLRQLARIFRTQTSSPRLPVITCMCRFHVCTVRLPVFGVRMLSFQRTVLHYCSLLLITPPYAKVESNSSQPLVSCFTGSPFMPPTQVLKHEINKCPVLPLKTSMTHKSWELVDMTMAGVAGEQGGCGNSNGGGRVDISVLCVRAYDCTPRKRGGAKRGLQGHHIQTGLRGDERQASTRAGLWWPRICVAPARKEQHVHLGLLRAVCVSVYY